MIAIGLCPCRDELGDRADVQVITQVGGLNDSGVVDSGDRLAAMKLLAGTCLILHSFIAERVGPYIM